MSVIVILIIFSVLVAAGFLAAFIWAVKGGQYDDTTSPAVRILNDDKRKNEPSENSPDQENIMGKKKMQDASDIRKDNSK